MATEQDTEMNEHEGHTNWQGKELVFDMIHAPFTPQQVQKLQEWQDCDWVHPFTCGNNRSDAAHQQYAKDHDQVAGILVPTEAGWICPVPGCGYKQNWAHKFMAQGAPPKPFLPSDQPIPTPETDAVRGKIKREGVIDMESAYELAMFHAGQMEQNCHVLIEQNKKFQKSVSILTKKFEQLEQIEAEWNGHAAGEKLSGNIVKEATYKGTATGVRIAINVLTSDTPAETEL